MRLSQRASKLALSVTLALDARAKELIASGKDVVNMAVGEPDGVAPSCARAAAVARVTSGDVRYTPAGGMPELRKAVARELVASRGGDWTAGRVAICHSAKHALTATLLALVEEGDEVVVPLPAWASYFEEIGLCGGTPVLVAPAPGLRPDFDALRRSITPRTRGLFINSPSNPSGVVWTHAELEELGRIAVERDLWILSDEIYRRLVYGGVQAESPSSLSDAVRERTIIVDGASKAFAMTGYRIGFVAGPEDLVSAVIRLNSQMTGAPNTISQAAYLSALSEDPPEVEAMRRELELRRALLVDGLRELELDVPHPDGAFYAFPDVSRHLDQRGSVGFCEDLLDQQLLAIVPGEAFGLDRHVRLSYAASQERIREALVRLGSFLGARAQNQPARSMNQ